MSPQDPMPPPRQPGSFNPWTPEDDDQLVDLFNKNEDTIEQIAARMGRSGAALRARLQKLRMAGRATTKRQGTRRKARPGEEPTTVDDVVIAIDMLVDTTVTQRLFWATGFRTHTDEEADLKRAENEARCKNARTRLEDVLRRWQR